MQLDQDIYLAQGKVETLPAYTKSIFLYWSH